jgi:hypothetical protein
MGAVRNHRVFWLSIAAWSTFGLFASVDDYLMMEAHGGPPKPLSHFLIVGVPCWVLWGLSMPLVLTLLRRMQRWSTPRRIAAHGGMLLVATIGMALVYTLCEWLAHAPHGHGPQQMTLARVAHNFFCWIPMCLIAYVTVVGIASAIDYARRTREQALMTAQLAQQLTHAQLGALRMQLQPHFFFNTLNSISMMVRAGENKRAVEMLAVLGEVLRTLLRRSPSLETTLADELAFLRRYLEIEQVRFGERLEVRFVLGAEVDDALVPPLMLQPLIENALRHGIDPRPDGGVLTVAAQRRGEALEIEVADDGVGLPPGFCAEESSGLGLTNTRARLERMYGPAASLAVDNGPAGGVRVRCRLPFHVQAMPPTAVAAHA